MPEEGATLFRDPSNRLGLRAVALDAGFTLLEAHAAALCMGDLVGDYYWKGLGINIIRLERYDSRTSRSLRPQFAGYNG